MIPVFKPYIGSDTIKAAVDALDMGWLGMGSYVNEFEQRLTSAFELPSHYKLVCVNTCTSALHLALLAAGVGPGDEVITPALNNVGDLQAIGMCGGKPVFVDISERDLCINPDLIEALITPKTKAIIALHYTGATCQIERVLEIGRKHGLRVLEDCAHATGSRVNGKPVGSYGDMACFSFDAIKTVTCVDGGAIVVPKAEEASQFYPLRLMGMTQTNDRLYSNNRAYQYDVPVQGFRYHLANLHASVGLSQLAKLPEFMQNRRRYSRLYNSMIKDVEGVVMPEDRWDEASIFHYCLRVPNGKRPALQEHMRGQGVDTGIHWLPGNRFSLYKNCKGADEVPVTDKIGDEILTLPLWSYMTDDVIATVSNSIRSFFGMQAV